MPDDLIGLYHVALGHSQAWQRDPRRRRAPHERTKSRDPCSGALIIWTLCGDSFDEAAFGEFQGNRIAKVDSGDWQAASARAHGGDRADPRNVPRDE